MRSEMGGGGGGACLLTSGTGLSLGSSAFFSDLFSAGFLMAPTGAGSLSLVWLEDEEEVAEAAGVDEEDDEEGVGGNGGFSGVWEVLLTGGRKGVRGPKPRGCIRALVMGPLS